MLGQPTEHTARSLLRTERRPYNRDEARAIAPDGHGVYAIWVGEYECLYIGKSETGNSVRRRLLDHLLAQEPNRNLRHELYRSRDIAEFAYCLTDCQEWADELERRLIQHFDPIYNHQRPSPRHPR